jgi:hypothetical protein
VKLKDKGDKATPFSIQLMRGYDTCVHTNLIIGCSGHLVINVVYSLGVLKLN